MIIKGKINEEVINKWENECHYNVPVELSIPLPTLNVGSTFTPPTPPQPLPDQRVT